MLRGRSRRGIPQLQELLARMKRRQMRTCGYLQLRLKHLSSKAAASLRMPIVEQAVRRVHDDLQCGCIADKVLLFDPKSKRRIRSDPDRVA